MATAFPSCERKFSGTSPLKVEPRLSVRLLECPTCSVSTLLPLSKNFALIEQLEQLPAFSAQRMCDNCDGPDRASATLFCDMCQAHYCHECSAATHALRALQSHRPAPIGSAPSALAAACEQCTQHDEPLKFYCNSCNVTMCRDCKDYGLHQNHPHDLLTNKVDGMKQELTGLLAPLEAQMAVATSESQQAWALVEAIGGDQSSCGAAAEGKETSSCAAAQFLTETISMRTCTGSADGVVGPKNAVTEAKDRVRAHFAQLAQALQRRCGAMLAEVDETKVSKLARVEDRQQALGSYLSHGHAASCQANCVIQATNPTRAAQLYADAHAALLEFNDTPLPTWQPIGPEVELRLPVELMETIGAHGQIVHQTCGSAGCVQLRAADEVSLTISSSDKVKISEPAGVVVDSANGNMLIASCNNHRVLVLSLDGTWVRTIGKQGSGDGQFKNPVCVAVDREGKTMLVADSSNNRIQVMRPDGTFIRSIGSQGRAAGQFRTPSGVAVGADGNIVVADFNNHRIQVLKMDGTHVRSIGKEGAEAGQFKCPKGIAIDANGNILVADCHNHRIQILRPNGSHVRTIGSLGSGNSQFKFPHGVAVDGSGNILVADFGNNRVQVLRPDGTYLRSVGKEGVKAAEFKNPHGVAVDGSGNILVADFGNNRVQVIH